MKHIFVLLYFQWISIQDGFLPRHMATVALADFVFGGADDPLRLGVFAKRVVQPRPGRGGPWFQWKCLVVFPLSTLNNYHLRTWWFLRPDLMVFSWLVVLGFRGLPYDLVSLGVAVDISASGWVDAHWAPELINYLRSPVDLKASLKDYKKTRY